MWKDKLKEVIYILENSDVNEIEVRFWFRKIKVTKKPSIISPEFSKNLNTLTSHTNEELQSSPKKEDNESVTANDKTFTVHSPMPGTFYSSPDPDSSPFVKKDSSVNEGDTLCIIEAMKIMNEIQCERGGSVKEVLVENGSPVEFDQPLFILNCSE
tara:strand:- start:614 stop:1081 length:468 start_codon:yes stop_codon:yes gene_type:complete